LWDSGKQFAGIARANEFGAASAVHEEEIDA